MTRTIFDGVSFETIRVPVTGGEVATYSVGSGDETLLLLHGGPGLSCDYLRDSHAHLADRGYRVVAYDQLGCGASDRPDDPGLWTLERYVAEVEQVRLALGLGRVHLLGQSWGAFLSIEYALTYPDALKSLVVEGGAADMPHLTTELERLRSALGAETVAMMHRHEAEGTYDHPEYRGAMDVLNWRHVCRLPEWPPALMRSISNINGQVAMTIVGPNDYCFTGSLRDWNRLADLHRIKVPTLVLCGRHDEVTPASAKLVHDAVPGSEMVIFPNSSHSPFFEEADAYFPVLGAFLDAQSGAKVRP